MEDEWYDNLNDIDISRLSLSYCRKFITKVIKQVRCEKCGFIPLPPPQGRLLLCRKGHLICNKCCSIITARIHFCPICDNFIDTDESIHYLEGLNSLLSHVPRRCTVTKLCSFHQTYTNLLKHSQFCVYKRYKCVVNNCNFYSYWEKMNDHLGDLDQPIEGGLDIGHTPIYYQNLEEHE